LPSEKDLKGKKGQMSPSATVRKEEKTDNMIHDEGEILNREFHFGRQ